MNKEQQTIDPVFALLRDPRTIRARAQGILDLARQNKLTHFTVVPEKMASTATFVTDVILDQYPQLNIPYHSRWRHFESGGIPRIAKMRQQWDSLPQDEWGKVLYELVILSVFLDAGAGPSWCYVEPGTGVNYSRSEGLALASLFLYQNGMFSAHPAQPLRVDAQRLIELNEDDLAQGFQVSPTNPLEGCAGRITLLNRLGKTLQDNPMYFGETGRLGEFYTYIHSLAYHHSLQAADIFQAVLDAFNPIWPTRLTFKGTPLGDVWQHNALKTAVIGSDYVPFHKLSQWLTYSLIEPLEQADIQVLGLEVLTGLPEYRNGGLLIDSGLICLKDTQEMSFAHDPGSELIVEWRALTVALLDELAQQIRKNLQKDITELPLAKILQGGTWEAGRRIAKQKRKLGTPPLQIISDGTVF